MQSPTKIEITEDPRISRLELLFRRTCSLPQLPTALHELLKAVDDEKSSAQQLERIIVADPNLAAKILQVANSTWAPSEYKTANIREAVLRIGTSSIRSLALSLIVSSAMPVPAKLSRERICEHSLYVAFIARYLYVRHSALMGAAWSKDEMFSAALLHDISCPLLGSLDAPTFERVTFYATRHEMTLNEAFRSIFGRDLISLSGLACQTWRLPDMFLEVMTNLCTPWASQDHYAEISCIAYADYLANAFGKTIENWPLHCEAEPEVAELVAIPDDEAKMLVERVSEQVESFTGLFHKAA